MKKILFSLVLFMPLCAWCQESSYQEEFAGIIQYNSGQLISLAEAIPEDKYDWRPSEGVRSVGEALMHVASANYFFSSMVGAELPEGVDLATFEKSTTGKENIVTALKESYAFLIETGKAFPDSEFGTEVSFPNGMKFSKRSTLMIVQSHCSEHMGQLVAYARMNDITPPWSMPDEVEEEN